MLGLTSKNGSKDSDPKGSTPIYLETDVSQIYVNLIGNYVIF